MRETRKTEPRRGGEPTLAELRQEIDRIDEAMHGLLIERGEIIESLIAVKRTQESGAAFRPAREAAMMRRLVERHRGLLPLDTVESIWRVIISTFTFVQANYAVHADMSAGDALDARFRALPFRLHRAAEGRMSAPRRWSPPSPPRRAISGLCRPPRSRARTPGGARSKTRARRRSSRGFPSSSDPIIRRRCRSSWCRSRSWRMPPQRGRDLQRRGRRLERGGRARDLAARAK